MLVPLLAAALAPAFALTDLQGNSLSSASLRGNVVVLAFFASWCPPCRDEVPALIALQRLEGVKVIGISFDERAEDAVRFAASRSINYRIARISPQFDAAYGRLLRLRQGRLLSGDGLINATLPTAIVLDRRGRVAGVFVGSARFPQAEARVRSLYDSTNRSQNGPPARASSRK